ncbi:MAG: glycosyl transferase [Bacteroidetes bacterium]|nr:MAG: glycosyl transferase [Bacteroidota bacterium]
MINFCTLFDSNYLARGLALYESLINYSPSFHLYVLTFDEKTFQYLSQQNLEHLTPIALRDFEDEELLRVKPSRTAAEYCWTCTPSLVLYCVMKFNLPSCTYIDADMIFYHNPQLLLDEGDGCSILISPHNYTRDYDESATHGTYCVQFMYFKNDSEGILALRWWRERCIEWCHAYLEDGKFGDQRYIEDWPTRFQKVHVMQHPGGGLAPWNLQQYEVMVNDKRINLTRRRDPTTYPLVFFHFHGLKFYTDEMVSCTGPLYEIDAEVKKLIYFPYITRLLQLDKKLRAEGVNFDSNGAQQEAPSKQKTYIQFMKDLLIAIGRGRFFLISFKKFNFKLHNHFYPTRLFK